MKVFLTAIALATTFANQADAQVARPLSAQSPRQAVPVEQGYVQPNRHTRSTNPAHDVFDIQGRYIGSDPDPTVRSMMQLDPTGGD